MGIGDKHQYGLPVALYHPTLAKLQHRLQTLDLQVGRDRGCQDESYPSRDDFEIARQFHQRAYQLYKNEDNHWEALKPFFNNAFNSHDLVEEKGSTFEGGNDRDQTSKGHEEAQKAKPEKGVNRVDAQWSYNGATYAALEDKVFTGLAGDATLQSIVWYAKHSETMKVCTHRILSLCRGRRLMQSRSIISSPSCPLLLSASWATCSRFR